MSRLVAQFSGPPADRMAGRQQARAAASAARAAAAKPQGNYKPKAKAAEQTGVSEETTQRANAFLDREALLDRAVHAGCISQGMRSHYAAAYDADPAGCRTFLATLGLRDEAPAASSGDSLLSASEQERVTAAREGKTSRIVDLG
ncbi:MAG TPA: hypothetical protein VH081_07020 [Solirubrobacteraceae bacterium]|jgi:hypothetical protein|nr:hypothetical protein [Solirubrobacteraceae bacterium]